MNDVPVPHPCTRPLIGVFDSGVGGLSVLRALHRRLPGAPMVYVGDVAHAPYGGRPVAEVLQRATAIVQWLIDQGASLIVVACNTATVLGIDHLRARWPGKVFVGVEPGVKPAAANSRARRIAVMSTAATAASDRLRELITQHARDVHVHVEACHDLAAAIENGSLSGPALDAVLQPHCDAMRAALIDTVVLGCTHYPFVEQAIRDQLGARIAVIDTAAAVAERAASLWDIDAQGGTRPSIRILSTGAADTMQKLLGACAGLEALPVGSLAI